MRTALLILTAGASLSVVAQSRPFSPEEAVQFRESIEAAWGSHNIWRIDGSIDTENNRLPEAVVVSTPYQVHRRFCFAQSTVFQGKRRHENAEIVWNLDVPADTGYFVWDIPGEPVCEDLDVDDALFLGDLIDTDTLELIVDSRSMLLAQAKELIDNDTLRGPQDYQLTILTLWRLPAQEGVRYHATFMEAACRRASKCAGVSLTFRMIRRELRVTDAFQALFEQR